MLEHIKNKKCTFFGKEKIKGGGHFGYSVHGSHKGFGLRIKDFEEIDLSNCKDAMNLNKDMNHIVTQLHSLGYRDMAWWV